MKDYRKTKVQLIREVESLRQQIAELKATASESERGRAETVLRRQAKLLHGVNEATHRLLTAPTLPAALTEALAILGEAAEVDRVYVFELHAHPRIGEAVLSQRFEWVREGVPAQLATPVFQNVSLAAPGMRWWYEVLAARRSLSGPRREVLTEGRQFFELPGTLSVLVVPIIVEEQFWGFLGLDDCHAERRWSQTEETLFLTMAANIGAAIQRRRMEEALRQSEERFRVLIENTLDIITVLETDGTIRYQSPWIERVLGYRPGELIGHNVFVYLHPEDVAAVVDLLLHVVHRPERVSSREFRFRHRDGSWHVLEAMGNLLRERSGATKVLINTRDITERKRMEEALRESEERYRNLFENANDAIATLTLDGIVTSVNRGLEVMLGWSREELLGRHYRKFVSPASVALGEERTRRFLAGERLPSIFEGEQVRKDGRVVPVEVRIRAIRDKEGRPIGFQGIYRDVTERKRAEAELLQAKEAAEAANRTKSEFLATMSHELRTPLSVILGYTALLLDGTFDPPTAAQVDPLRRVDTNARELLDLISAILNVSQLEAGRLPVEIKEVRVHNLLHEIKAETSGLQEQSGLAFVWQVDDNLPPLRTDPDKLKIVIKNLIGNAVKFTQQGSITVAAHGDAGGVELRVTDTGVGIPREALALIFEPFRQVEGIQPRRYGGTGLGLHIVKRLLELLGGTVTVESEVGRGSTFRVWAPARQHTENDTG